MIILQGQVCKGWNWWGRPNYNLVLMAESALQPEMLPEQSQVAG